MNTIRYILSPVIMLLSFTASSETYNADSIIKAATEAFSFGHYKQAEDYLSRVYFDDEIASSVDGTIINKTDKAKVVNLVSLILWETNRVDELKTHVGKHYDSESQLMWTCRIKMRSSELMQSSDCFYRNNETQRSKRDFREGKINELIITDGTVWQ